MQTELKKDKFRHAILLALEEKRMSDNEKLDVNLVRKDAQELYKALTSKEGGETAMINIIVVRSDNHLREVLRTFEASYRKNFAREMIQKSRNLVVRVTHPVYPVSLHSSSPLTLPGRNPRPHTQRRPQPPRPRRSPPPSSHYGNKQRPHRPPRQPPCALPLGAKAPDESQRRVSKEVREEARA